MKLSSIIITFLLLAAAGIAWAQNEEARKHLHHAGGPFIVYRDKVWEDLQLSDDQKQKLLEKLPDYNKAFENLKDLEAEDRKKEVQKSGELFEAFLKETLKADQLKRFQQLKLQYDLPTTLLQPEIVKELKITDEQRQQFIGLVQEMQKKIEPLITESQSSGNPEEIRPKVIGLRMDCTGKIEAILSDAQRKQWKEMLGKPLIIW